MDPTDCSFVSRELFSLRSLVNVHLIYVSEKNFSFCIWGVSGGDSSTLFLFYLLLGVLNLSLLLLLFASDLLVLGGVFLWAILLVVPYYFVDQGYLTLSGWTNPTSKFFFVWILMLHWLISYNNSYTLRAKRTSVLIAGFINIYA